MGGHGVVRRRSFREKMAVLVFYAGSWGESRHIGKGWCEAMVVDSGCRLVAGGVLLCGRGRGSCTNSDDLVRYILRGSTLIADEKSQEGSKGGNGFFHLRWVLLGVGSKAIVDHTSLVNLHADGGEESGATSKIPSK
jgi:hypothetical protein